MLVLGRYVDQTILIGDDIEITVTKVHADGMVRLGITAPRRLQVDRKEVRERILADAARETNVR